MQGVIYNRLALRRREIPSRLSVSFVVSFIFFNCKVLFCNFINSLWKETSNNVVSFSSLQSDEPHLGEKPIEVLLQTREERLIFRILLRVARVTVVNEWSMTAILYLGHHMAIFYVRALASILYIGQKVSFCKKCTI